MATVPYVALNQAGRQSEAIGLLEQLASNAVVECRCVLRDSCHPEHL